ncbi:hypothetical protein [Entomomonas asaccharolytica]|uniref:Uncharacterized protein n=1 Tax=Entomomonas asaccharolytica TaxID=2785331 RepID=A0A974RWE8_9GAMM|nr:hypothetical protein [Entomomonas asaccharolytica]QQP85057.1 hypothetical protein JHT90_11770 [Entomomonas asaccharolytica]
MILVKLAWNNAYHKVNKIILNLNGKMHEVKKGVINIGIGVENINFSHCQMEI